MLIVSRGELSVSQWQRRDTNFLAQAREPNLQLWRLSQAKSEQVGCDILTKTRKGRLGPGEQMSDLLVVSVMAVVVVGFGWQCARRSWPLVERAVLR
jgi:hypothetical protein